MLSLHYFLSIYLNFLSLHVITQYMQYLQRPEGVRFPVTGVTESYGPTVYVMKTEPRATIRAVRALNG